MSRASIPELQTSVLVRSAAGQIATFPWGLWGFRYIVDRLGLCESRRRLLHMLPGLLPALLWMIPHRDPWGAPLIGSVLGVSFALIAYAILRESDFARPDESQWHVSVVGYTLPVVAMLLLFPGRSELGLMTLGVLAFGDGSAVLGGKLWGRHSLPWNHRKTWAGMCCFVVAGTIAASLNYWIESRPAVSLVIALGIAVPASLAAAVAESLPLRTHDNFRVGMTATLTGLLMHILLLGW